jgi:hypothetical protein
MTLKQFFSKSVGVWKSHRSYFYKDKNFIEDSVTVFEWSKVDINNYSVEWVNSINKRERTMSVCIKDDFRIERSNGYYSSKPTTSNVVSCSPIFLKTITEYNFTSFDERIEFITNDLRIRRTIATDLKTGEIILVGNYIEKRICQEYVGDVSEDLEGEEVM